MSSLIAPSFSSHTSLTSHAFPHSDEMLPYTIHARTRLPTCPLELSRKGRGSWEEIYLSLSISLSFSSPPRLATFLPRWSTVDTLTPLSLLLGRITPSLDCAVARRRFYALMSVATPSPSQ
jgi:hypothetical protein